MDILSPHLLTVDGRTYRALYSPGAAPQQHRRRNRDAEEVEEEEEGWAASGINGGRGVSTVGWQEEPEEEPSVDILQEGDGYVARLGLDAEVGGQGVQGLCSKAPAALATPLSRSRGLGPAVSRPAAAWYRGSPLTPPSLSPCSSTRT